MPRVENPGTTEDNATRGIVSHYLRDVVARQVKEHGVVVWYDPERQYEAFVSDLAIPDAKFARYNGSFFDLRYQIEPLIGGLQPPKLVVYVPLDDAKTHHALAEIEAAGAVLRPGQQPPTRNTRLSVIARNALKPIIGEESARGIEKQVDAMQLSLANLDRLAEEGTGIATGVMSVVFGSGNPMDVAILFLVSDAHDADILRKTATSELSKLLHNAFDVEVVAEEELPTFRERFARHVLATELIETLRPNIPDRLTPMGTASTSLTREACETLARQWRASRDKRESYAEHAKRAEAELGLGQLVFELSQSSEIETFLEIERQLLRQVETELLRDADEDLVEIAKHRQSSFWSEFIPGVQARWSLIAAAGQVLLEATHVEKELKALAAGTEIESFVDAYTSSARPWCILDTYHRHMERHWHNFEFELGSVHESLERLIAKARHRFMEVGGKLSEAFVRRYQSGDFRFPGLTQREVYSKRVKPLLDQGKVAFIAVDALRFEMARELATTLIGEFNVSLGSAMGTVPTITPVGMAALLPDAERLFTLTATTSEKLGVEVDGALLKDRKDRLNFLQQRSGVRLFTAKLEDLLPKPKKKTLEGIAEADLIFITSQEIDALCEGDSIPLARRFMDEILHDLRRACRILAETGIRNIVFASDHGYVFGEELGSDMKIDAPGGDTLDLHRRVWIGRGGTSSNSYLRARVSDLGLSGDLEFATPWNFACFKTPGGAKAYFHGGLSPQEAIIPVMTLVSVKQRPSAATSDLDWILIPGSQKISTRFFSVQVTAQSKSLLQSVPPRIRIEVRSKNERLSVPVSASYGFEEGTGDVQLRFSAKDPNILEPNTITLMITDPQKEKVVSVNLLDALTGTRLAALGDIEMGITM